MIFKFNKAMDQHRKEVADNISKETKRYKWNEETLLTFIFLGSISDTNLANEIASKSTKKGIMDFKLTVNNIEVNLMKGLKSILVYLNKEVEPIHETDKIIELYKYHCNCCNTSFKMEYEKKMTSLEHCPFCGVYGIDDSVDKELIEFKGIYEIKKGDD